MNTKELRVQKNHIGGLREAKNSIVDVKSVKPQLLDQSKRVL